MNARIHAGLQKSLQELAERRGWEKLGNDGGIRVVPDADGSIVVSCSIHKPGRLAIQYAELRLTLKSDGIWKYDVNVGVQEDFLAQLTPEVILGLLIL